MIGFFSQSPDCNDEQTIQRIYGGYDSPYDVCTLDRAKIRAGKVYFAVACANCVFIILTTAVFIYLANSSKTLHFNQPISQAPDQQRLFRQWQRTSLQRRSAFGTSLGAVGHLVFSTGVFLSQSYYGTGTCEIYLWGVILGFYTWTFALLWRAFRLHFLLKLNAFKIRYASIHCNAENERRVDEDRDYQWLLHHKDCRAIHIARPLAAYILIFSVLVVVCVLAEWRNAECEFKWGIFILLGFVGFFLLVVAPMVVWRSHNYKDAHGIRNEILIDLAAGAICFILTMIWYFFINGRPIRSPNGNYFNRFFAPRNWLVFFTTIGHITSVVYPIYQLVPEWFRFRRRLDDRSSRESGGGGRRGSQSSRTGRPVVPQTPEALEQLLRDPQTVEELVQLAVQDFSSENVLAYKEYLKLVDRLQYLKYGRVVKRFSRRCYSSASTLVGFETINNVTATSAEKDHNLLTTVISGPSSLLDDFAKYYDTYIRQGAPLQVNISYRARHELDSFFTRARSTHQIDNIDVNDDDTITATDLITPWSHKQQQPEPLLPVHTNDRRWKQQTRWSWSLSTEFLPYPLSRTATGPQLTLSMFEGVRNELFWNIFASVFPKYINSQ